MLSWIQAHKKDIGVVATSVAFAGALIGWHYVSLIPGTAEDIQMLFAFSCLTTALTIGFYWTNISSDWNWRKTSLLDKPLPILAAFVWPMFIGTWNILWDVHDYLGRKECRALSTKGYNYVWRDGVCHTPEEWKLRLCDLHPTTCD